MSVGKPPFMEPVSRCSIFKYQEIADGKDLLVMLRECGFQILGNAKFATDLIQQVSCSIEEPSALFCRNRSALQGLCCLQGYKVTAVRLIAFMLSAALFSVPERSINEDISLSLDVLSPGTVWHIHKIFLLTRYNIISS